MADRKQMRGPCAYCGREMARSGMSRHLSACPERRQATEQADKGRGKKQLLYHLAVRDAASGAYWLHLEVKGSSKLADLDDYLRAIWLECCGHLSMFSVGGWAGDEIAVSTRIDRAFRPGSKLTHIYDFGTSSETLISYVSAREGKPLTSHPIALMARNNPPPYVCKECDQLATVLCIECTIEHDESGLLCEQHAKDHPHEDYGEPVPLVNSPRIGMCGYVGPAEPPY